MYIHVHRHNGHLVIPPHLRSFQAKFRLGSLKVSLSTCLNDCHSGLLSKGPGESADGDHHLRHHHHHNFITIIGFGAQGRAEFSGTVSHPKVQTLSNRTPNQQWPWNGVQPTATTGGAAGGHTTGNHRGRGWDTMGWGGCESTTFQNAQQTTLK